MFDLKTYCIQFLRFDSLQLSFSPTTRIALKAFAVNQTKMVELKSFLVGLKAELNKKEKFEIDRGFEEDDRASWMSRQLLEGASN